jgi:cyclase
MQEICKNVYIDTSYEGVTLSALRWPHGMILIDAPFHPEDMRSWRSSLMNMGGGKHLLICMDYQYDRVLGLKAMESIVVAHDEVSNNLQARPATFKTIPADMGCEWERFENLGNVRWTVPEISFSDEFTIAWDGNPINLISRPGCAEGAIWVQLPEEKIVFVGDCVIAHQPPFFETANIPVWMQNLKELLSPMYQDYTIIGGRNGVLHASDVEKHLQFLDTTYHRINNLANGKGNVNQIKKIAAELVEEFPTLDQYRKTIYQNRLCYGLTAYFQARYIAEPEMA